MEGINMTGFLLGYLAVLVCAIMSLIALVLLIARLAKASRIMFASGLLAGTIIAALADLTFLEVDRQERQISIEIVLIAATLISAGAGQFIAALRRPLAYVLALGCAAGSLGLLGVYFFGAVGFRAFFGAGTITTGHVARISTPCVVLPTSKS